MKAVLKCQWCGIEAEIELKTAKVEGIFEFPGMVCAAPEHGPAAMRVEGYRDAPRARS